LQLKGDVYSGFDLSPLLVFRFRLDVGDEVSVDRWLVCDGEGDFAGDALAPTSGDFREVAAGDAECRVILLVFVADRCRASLSGFGDE